MKPVIMVPPKLFSQYAIYNKHALYVHSNWVRNDWFLAQLAETLHKTRVPVYYRIDSTLNSYDNARAILEHIPQITHVFIDLHMLFNNASTISEMLYDMNFTVIGVVDLSKQLPILRDDVEGLLTELSLSESKFGLAFKKEFDGFNSREITVRKAQKLLDIKGPLIGLGLWTDLTDFIAHSPSTIMNTLITSFPVKMGACARSLDDGKPYPKNLEDTEDNIPYPMWTKSAIQGFINMVEAIKVTDIKAMA